MYTPPLKRLECSARPAALLLILCARAMAQSGTYSDMTEYPVPTPNSFPAMITAGPDGALWFTETQGNQIGRITSTGVVTEYPVPTPSSHPWGITAGPDGALWFTEYQGNQIGRITTAGIITEYIVVPGSPTQTYPQWITAGPDGALWFTLRIGIGRITTAGIITRLYVVGGG